LIRWIKTTKSQTVFYHHGKVPIPGNIFSMIYFRFLIENIPIDAELYLLFFSKVNRRQKITIERSDKFYLVQ